MQGAWGLYAWCMGHHVQALASGGRRPLRVALEMSAPCRHWHAEQAGW